MSTFLRSCRHVGVSLRLYLVSSFGSRQIATVASLAAKTAGAINFAFLRHRVPQLVESCLLPLTRRIGSSFANGTKVCAASSFHELFPQGKGDMYLQYLRTDLWRTLFCASLRWIRCCKMAGCAGTPKLDAIKQESVA